MVGNQIGNLTSGLSFGHNFYFKNPNGSCKLILDIHVLRAFQWYNELINQMSFDPYNHPEYLEVHWDSNFQSGSSLGIVGVHSLTLSCTPGNMKCDSQASLLAHTFASPYLGHKPKVKVVIRLKILLGLFRSRINHKCNKTPQTSKLRRTLIMSFTPNMNLMKLLQTFSSKNYWSSLMNVTICTLKQKIQSSLLQYDDKGYQLLKW